MRAGFDKNLDRMPQIGCKETTDLVKYTLNLQPERVHSPLET